MKVIQLADARDELALHLEYVRHGGTVRIVDHDRPVADLVPVSGDNDNAADDEAMLAALEGRGLVRRGTGGPLPEELFHPGPAAGRAGVLDALLAERRGAR